MSLSTEICLAYAGSLLDLKAVVEHVLGFSFQQSECDNNERQHRFYGWFIGMDVELAPNYLETDGHLNFSDFSYLLATRTGAGYLFNETIRPLQGQLANGIGLMLSYHLGVDVMVTVDAQRLSARYTVDEVRAKYGSPPTV